MDTEEAGAREHMMDSSLLAYRVPDFLNALGSISHLSRLCPGPPLSQEQDHLWCHWYLEDGAVVSTFSSTMVGMSYR